MTTSLSVCILACDEENELARCIRSVEWADEVVVLVDDKSRDGTEAVARRLASRVERHPYAGDIDQKRNCVALAKNDWVLVLDPDEVVSEALAASIRGCLDGDLSDEDSAPVGYRFNRATFHLGRWIRHGDFYPDWKLRLFRRSRARWVGRDPHGRVDVDGVVMDIEGQLLHFSYRDLSDQISRIQFFSSQAARGLAKEGAKFRIRDLVLRPPARFLRSYVLRGGFRDGLPGFVIGVASAFYVFLKYAKLWELRSLSSDEDRPI